MALPELVLTGYPPEDLLLKPAFINKNLEYLEKVKELTENLLVIFGFVGKTNETFNSAAIIFNKKLLAIYNKQHLSNYSVFDEERYFRKGEKNILLKFKENLIGINICEDIYCAEGPTKIQAILGGAELIINISASPYHIKKVHEREKMLHARAIDSRACILYVNIVGGQDELVFDGNSMILNAEGDIIARCAPFEEDFLVYDLDLEEVQSIRLKDAKFKNQRLELLKSEITEPKIIKIPFGELKKPSIKKTPNRQVTGKSTTLAYNNLISCKEEEILKALILGTKDYLHKNRFKKAVLGLSGGVDSALCAVIACFALGNENVTGVLMPSMFSSKESIDDSILLAKNLKINYLQIPITQIYFSYIENLKDIFKSEEINLTKENVQARIRGNILMALSNEFGWLVLSAGNKSEISVGYCTLYGDMVGGLSPLKDIYKTEVYKLCNFINQKFNNLIPKSILTRAPTAELKPNQKDEDSLPPYNILDQIIKSYIENDMDYDYVVNNLGFPAEIVKKVIKMIDSSEYKRRQGPPGIKITQRASGKDRRYPITNKFSEY